MFLNEQCAFTVVKLPLCLKFQVKNSEYKAIVELPLTLPFLSVMASPDI